jgi:glycosyltransferase involved in cell wall biosynthesis
VGGVAQAGEALGLADGLGEIGDEPIGGEGGFVDDVGGAALFEGAGVGGLVVGGGVGIGDEQGGDAEEGEFGAGGGAGADFFLLDRRVMEVLKVFKESNVSLLALLTWMGFRQDQIFYVKQAREHGQSGWNLEKKLKLVVDSITSFTYKPIRLMSVLGFVVALLGFLYAMVVVFYRLVFSTQVPGYPSLIVAILVVGGLQMIMMGVLGEYIWRALDEARSRPRFIVEDEVGFEDKEG